MAGINSTGLPRTADYNLGRGKVYFAPLDSQGHPTAYEDLGNSPEFSLSVDSETLEHQSSRGGLKVVDKEVIISQSVSITLSLDEVNFGNIARFLSGTSATRSNQEAVDGVVGTASVAVPAYAGGRWFDLYNTATGITSGTETDSNALRIYDIGALTVTDPSGCAVTTDYEVDSEMGRIFIVNGSTLLDTTPAFTMDVTYAAKTDAAATIDVAKALTQTNITGALKFITENPADNDRQTEFQFHQISLKAEGDFSLIGDDWSVMQLTGVAESNVIADPDSPTLTITTHEYVAP